jgi:hypothetical protein
VAQGSRVVEARAKMVEAEAPAGVVLDRGSGGRGGAAPGRWRTRPSVLLMIELLMGGAPQLVGGAAHGWEGSWADGRSGTWKGEDGDRVGTRWVAGGRVGTRPWDAHWHTYIWRIRANGHPTC